MHSPLSDLTYRRLFTAQVTSLAGTGLSTIALALLAYDLAGGDAGMVLGTALALKMLVYVMVAPVIGAFANQLPRRALLIGLDIARAGIVFCIPFVTEIWQIYALIVALNACSAGFTPTFQATIPDVLPDDARYTRALSLSRLAYDLENLLSPLLAAAALLIFSYNTLFAINAVTFLVSASLVASIRLPAHQPTETEAGIWRNLTFGIRAYLATPRLRGLLGLSLAVASAGAMVIVNTVVYVRELLGGSETATAIALAAYGCGSMVVALGLPRLLDNWSDRPFMLAGGLSAALGLLLGLAEPGWLILLITWTILGMASSLVQTPAGRLLKRSASEENRPAIYAAQFALSHACWLLTYALAGWIGGNWGLPAAFVTLGILSALATAAAVRLWPNCDPLELPHTHEPLRHNHWHVHDAHHQHSHQQDEGPEPHRHPHDHAAVTHTHSYVIDRHHTHWPRHG